MSQRASSLNTFEKYKVVLCNADGKPRLDENGEQIIVIALPQDKLESKIFLTHADKYGQIRQACIGEALN